jgi:hypothetical protein
MQANVPRKFTLLDAMVLIAAIGSLPVRVRLIISDPLFLPAGYSWSELRDSKLRFSQILSLEPKNDRSMIETSACRQEAKHANRPIRSLEANRRAEKVHLG